MTREAKAAWARKRRRLMAYGRWEPTQQLDPTPARDHINRLRAFGLSIHTIADLAGERRGALSQIVYPNHSDYLTWITPARAERILAVSFNLDRIPAGRNVDASGTRRRIEALMLAGWSQGHIARALGVSRQRVSTYRAGAHVSGGRLRVLVDGLPARNRSTHRSGTSGDHVRVGHDFLRALRAELAIEDFDKVQAEIAQHLHRDDEAQP